MASEEKEIRVIKLKAIDITSENFSEFGQLIESSHDGAEFGPQDAQLQLHRGVPRFYIMRLEGRSLSFSSITHHASVTQCLGSIGGQEWYLGVAKPSIVDMHEDGRNLDNKAQQSKSGHHYIPPNPDEVLAFRISGPKFVKLNVGTWHAGPLFTIKGMDFYNLELSNTNVVDHTTHWFNKMDGVKFLIEN